MVLVCLEVSSAKQSIFIHPFASLLFLLSFPINFLSTVNTYLINITGRPNIIMDLAGALGSIVGYLGAEVAEDAIFENLLWPQRFYNDRTLGSLTQQFLFMGMGGPLHRAALATLDQLRDHGLYLGPRRGDMLGTAFYKDLSHTRDPDSF